MKNAALVWLLHDNAYASQRGGKSHRTTIERAYRSGSTGTSKYSVRAIGSTPVRSIQQSELPIGQTLSGRVLSRVSELFSAIRLLGQRDVDQMMVKQNGDAAAEFTKLKSDWENPAVNPASESTKERIQRYKCSGM